MVRSSSNTNSSTPDCHQLTQLAGRLISKSLAPGSQDVYRRAVKKYANFCLNTLHSASFFPISVHNLILFASYLFSQKLAPATIQTYILAVCFVNNLASGVNHAKSFLIKKILQGIHRESAPKAPRPPITASILQSLLNKVHTSALSAYDKLLYAAMFNTAFHCFLRVGEFTVRSNSLPTQILQFSDVNFLPSKHNTQALDFQLTLTFFKGNTTRAPFNILVPSQPSSPWCPVASLRFFLAARGSSPGPLFCHVNLRPISRAEFSNCLSDMLSQAGFSSCMYKPHSFRIGAATTAAMSGIQEDIIQRLSRWRSSAYKRYIRVPVLHSV